MRSRRIFPNFVTALFLCGLAFYAYWQATSPPSQFPEYQPFTAERLQAHLANGRCVFVDANADWMQTSASQLGMMSRRPADRIRKHKMQALRADFTETTPELRAFQVKHQFFVPAILLFSPQAPNEPMVFREYVREDVLLRALDESQGKIPQRWSERCDKADTDHLLPIPLDF